MLADSHALVDPALRVWALAESLRAAIAANARSADAARQAARLLYGASRPSPQIARRALNLLPTVTVGRRVYVL